MKEFFYNQYKSYEDNFITGPFIVTEDKDTPIGEYKSQFDFFGKKIVYPFGIPAGPLLNGNFVRAAWNKGFPLPTYKTVRAAEHQCFPWPNIISVESKSEQIHPGDTVLGKPEKEINVYSESITNSFGVPSQPVPYWQEDVSKLVSIIPDGASMILSFMGTKAATMTLEQYAENFKATLVLAKETQAPVLEVNFSCPNVGKEGLICDDLQTSAILLEHMHSVLGNVPLLVKIGYIPRNDVLYPLLDVIHQYAHGVVAINTIQAKVVDTEGNKILPGPDVRMYSGICGLGIQWAGLEMATRIMEYKRIHNWRDFTVVGVGGVLTAGDVGAYMDLGVDAVQSATGAMWNPNLAIEVLEQYGNSN